LLGQIALIVFCLAYAYAALNFSWQVAIALGTLACISTGFLVTSIKISIWLTAPALIIIWLIAMKMWPKVSIPTLKLAPPRWELPVRILVTLILLVSLSALAPHVGAKAAGAMSTYPVIASVLGAFNHRRFGANATVSTLRGLMQTLPITMGIIFALGLILR
jgi:hypothetical protein